MNKTFQGGLKYSFVFVSMVTLIAFFLKGKIQKTCFNITQITDDQYDYVIVGGGTAGCVLAARLAEDPDSKVLLLEAGGNPEGVFIYEAPLAYNQTWGNEDEWDYRTEHRSDIYKGLRNNEGLLLKGKVLGGSSVIGMMEYSRGISWDYTDWEQNHSCKGWGSEDVYLYFTKLEDCQIKRRMNSGFRSKGGPIAVEEVKQTPISDLFLQAGKDMGYNIVDLNGDHVTGFDRYQASIRNDVRSSPATDYLFKNRKKENLHVSIDSFVEKIDIQKQQAVGVVFIRKAQRKYVRARKEVLLSAGVINSPQILMLSGIGPKAHLEEKGIKVIADLPVGDNLHDHVSLMMLSKVKEGLTITEEQIEEFIGQNGYKYFKIGPWAHPGSEGNAMLHYPGKEYESAPDIQLRLIPALETQQENPINCDDKFCEEYMYRHGDVPGITMVINLLHPKSRGTVRLSSQDPYDLPLVTLNQLTVREDMEGLIQGIRMWENFTQTPTMKKVGIDIEPTKLSFCLHHKYSSDNYWECVIRHFAFPAHNTAGTCKMGPADDKKAVTDLELMVRGIKGLRVVDASVFPTVTSGGSMVPVIMLAEKAADLIEGQVYNVSVPWESWP